MVSKLFDLFFGCSHKNYSFPRSARPGQRRNAAGARTGTYVVCLDCGKEFAYDWQEMRILTDSNHREKHPIEHLESFAAK